MRERVKNTYTSEPILTVQPTTEADMSQIANIQHLVNFDLAAYDAKQNVVVQN